MTDPNLYPKPDEDRRYAPVADSPYNELFDQEPEESKGGLLPRPLWELSGQRRRPKTMPWRGRWSWYQWHRDRRRLRDAAETATGKAMRAARRAGTVGTVSHGDGEKEEPTS